MIWVIQTARLFVQIAAFSGLLSVILGAFAAHSLKAVLAPEALQIIQTAVNYQITHALALFGVGVLMLVKPELSGLKASGIAFIMGSILFCGSLYGLALGAPSWLGPVTPVGGLSFMIGWLLLALSAGRLSVK